MSKGENTGTIVLAVLVSAVACVGLVMWGRSQAPSPSSANDGPEPVVFFPGLRVGSIVQVDTAAAMIPSSNMPTAICEVDMLLSDPALVSVRGVSINFRGTIPRSAIVRELVAPPAGVFT